HARSSGLSVIAKLKRLNRTSYFFGRDSKVAASSSRARLEKQHLDLQNLLYERTNLQEEIRKCHKREYSYTSVDMYTLEEFKQRAPAEMHGDGIDAHTLMLNRLKFELQERKR
ncbi:THO complex, subunit 5, partial [Thamnocephalis sphaerospora]